MSSQRARQALALRESSQPSSAATARSDLDRHTKMSTRLATLIHPHGKSQHIGLDHGPPKRLAQLQGPVGHLRCAEPIKVTVRVNAFGNVSLLRSDQPQQYRRSTGQRVLQPWSSPSVTGIARRHGKKTAIVGRRPVYAGHPLASAV